MIMQNLAALYKWLYDESLKLARKKTTFTAADIAKIRQVNTLETANSIIERLIEDGHVEAGENSTFTCVN